MEGTYMDMHIYEIAYRPLGDAALIIEFGQDIHLDIHKRVIQLVESMSEQSFAGFIEAVPSYSSVTIYYDPWIVYETTRINTGETIYETVGKWMEQHIVSMQTNLSKTTKCVEIPVVYGGIYGPDLEAVAYSHGLTEDEVIHIHTEARYTVYMIGFTPGFPFLGGMDKRIATPRRPFPRPSTPVGSVGIAGEQTGIYSLNAPGGWQIIGRTPEQLFTPKMKPPTLLEAGDTVTFKPIKEDMVKEWYS